MNNTCSDLSFEETSGYGAVQFPEQCANCESTENLNDCWPEFEPRPIRMCDDCCEEESKLEARAAALVAAESCCPARARIIDLCTKTQGLVNMLTAHDQTCTLCRPAQKMGPMQAALPFFQEVA